MTSTRFPTRSEAIRSSRKSSSSRRRSPATSKPIGIVAAAILKALGRAYALSRPLLAFSCVILLRSSHH